MERLEMVVAEWVKGGRVPSAAQIGRQERLLLPSLSDQSEVRLQIGSLALQAGSPDEMRLLLRQHQQQPGDRVQENGAASPPYILQMKSERPLFPWRRSARGRVRRKQVLVSLQQGATTEDIVQAVLQVAYIRDFFEHATPSLSEEISSQGEASNRVAWSHMRACASIGPLMEALRQSEWLCDRILLTPSEQHTFALAPSSCLGRQLG
eukprot:TRINITY_DN30786_c0_g1_i1.p1 TRINITY_DN30786_c0_g1~~TRINITY_DN30786_c0_g1_i1.p1  ORF type:complete len:208 (-),score=43.90 TRINITY_DN30786_c0_g1_i1:275-898(-)